VIQELIDYIFTGVVLQMVKSLLWIFSWN